jgi:enediyne biosynthesis protein E3
MPKDLAARLGAERRENESGSMTHSVSSALVQLRSAVLGISPSHATFRKRGFTPAGGAAQAHLEKIGCTFIGGYNMALKVQNLTDLSNALNSTDREFRGFAFEGAAMALTILDHLSLRSASRFERFLHGPGEPHAYMVHVGAGWAYARLPWLRVRIESAIDRMDSLLRWLAVDGFGFHEGYFAWPRVIVRQQIPRGIRGYARRAFDQGLGRSLWFVNCADISRIADIIRRFDESRWSDLWSGVGLACAYAGPCTEDELERLNSVTEAFRAEVVQGAAFAAKARLRADNLVPHTEQACWALCGVSAREAASITDCALKRLPGPGQEPTFEVWRRRIQLELGVIRRQG